MNNIFNINRFGLLLKRQWLDFGKIYLLSLLVIAGVLIGFYFYNIPAPQKHNSLENDGTLNMRFRYPLFVILGFLFISIVASSYFSSVGQKSKAILDLMTPASVFEKFLSGIFYTAIISLFSYLLIFYLTDLAFVKYLNSNIDAFKGINLKVTEAQSISYQIFNDKNYLKYCGYFFASPFLITSIFLLGSVYFNRFHYIKTAISVMIFSGIAAYIIFKAADFLTSDMVRVNHGNYRNNGDSVLLLILSITTALTIIFWAIAYIRLKEKEV